MNARECMQMIAKCEKDAKLIQAVSDRYSCKLPDILERLVSYCGMGIFLEDDHRILSYGEILDAGAKLHVDFVALRLIPIADCWDNDFAVYDIEKGTWALFNIGDGTLFMERQTLEELL